MMDVVLAKRWRPDYARLSESAVVTTTTAKNRCFHSGDGETESGAACLCSAPPFTTLVQLEAIHAVLGPDDEAVGAKLDAVVGQPGVADQHHIAVLAGGQADLARSRLDDHDEVGLAAVAKRDADAMLHPQALRCRTPNNVCEAIRARSWSATRGVHSRIAPPVQHLKHARTLTASTLFRVFVFLIATIYHFYFLNHPLLLARSASEGIPKNS